MPGWPFHGGTENLIELLERLKGGHRGTCVINPCDIIDAVPYNRDEDGAS